MNVPGSTKINNHHIPNWTFQELYKAMVAIHLTFDMSFVQGEIYF